MGILSNNKKQNLVIKYNLNERKVVRKYNLKTQCFEKCRFRTDTDRRTDTNRRTNKIFQGKFLKWKCQKFPTSIYRKEKKYIFVHVSVGGSSSIFRLVWSDLIWFDTSGDKIRKIFMYICNWEQNLNFKNNPYTIYREGTITKRNKGNFWNRD